MMNQNEINEYLKSAYPNNLRYASENDTSIIYKYDIVRAYTLFSLNQNIDEAVSRLLVTTSDLEGIKLWEEFLWITEDLNKTLSERKAAILSLFVWNNESISTLKQIVYQVIWWWEDSIEFKEYWKDVWVDPEDLFTYEIIINNSLISNSFSIPNLYDILVNIHPAHCTLIITLVQNLLDNIWINDTITTALHSEFDWGITSSSSSDDWFYADISNPLDWELWA